MDDYYAARSGLIPPLPWPTFSPPFSNVAYMATVSASRAKDNPFKARTKP